MLLFALSLVFTEPELFDRGPPRAQAIVLDVDLIGLRDHRRDEGDARALERFALLVSLRFSPELIFGGRAPALDTTHAHLQRKKELICSELIAPARSLLDRRRRAARLVALECGEEVRP